MINLKDTEKKWAASLMLDILISTNTVPNTRSNAYSENYFTITGNGEKGSVLTRVKPDVNTVKDAILNRTFNFKDVDKALEKFVSYKVKFGENTSPEGGRKWNGPAVEAFATLLAYVCQANGIYWDDTAYTAEELKTIVEDSIFAKALYKSECFVSQPNMVSAEEPEKATPEAEPETKAEPEKDTEPDAKPADPEPEAKPADADPTPAPADGEPEDKGETKPEPEAAPEAKPAADKGAKAPKSGYSNAGPQSKFVVGLVGAPGEKTMVASGKVYCIICDKEGKIIPNAFIHPVNNPDVGEKARVNADNKPIVKVGAGNGYTDLTIYTETQEAMTEIFNKLNAAKAFDKYHNARVVEAKANKDGYFKVDTEYGEVLVKPTKLHEALFEEIFEAMNATEALKAKELNEEAELAAYVEELASVPVIKNIDEFASYSAMYD